MRSSELDRHPDEADIAIQSEPISVPGEFSRRCVSLDVLSLLPKIEPHQAKWNVALLMPFDPFRDRLQSNGNQNITLPLNPGVHGSRCL